VICVIFNHRESGAEVAFEVDATERAAAVQLATAGYVVLTGRTPTEDRCRVRVERWERGLCRQLELEL
jgi:hypothetical protein